MPPIISANDGGARCQLDAAIIHLQKNLEHALDIRLVNIANALAIALQPLP